MVEANELFRVAEILRRARNVALEYRETNLADSIHRIIESITRRLDEAARQGTVKDPDPTRH
jgi:hypothetical protein